MNLENTLIKGIQFVSGIFLFLFRYFLCFLAFAFSASGLSLLGVLL